MILTTDYIKERHRYWRYRIFDEGMWDVVKFEPVEFEVRPRSKTYNALFHRKMIRRKPVDKIIIYRNFPDMSGKYVDSLIVHEIHYKEFKLKVSDLIVWCSTGSRTHLLDSLCYNTEEHCAYVRCFGLQFSFHGVAISRILDFINLKNNRIEKWDGIRLQPIAVDLFAISLSSDENTVALEIKRLLNQLYDD